MDLYYGATGDYEYYSPNAINTTNGALQITMTQKTTTIFNSSQVCSSHGTSSASKVVTSNSPCAYAWLPQHLGLLAWSLAYGQPRSPRIPRLTDGMWPYSYASCDAGILRNQTWVNGTGQKELSTRKVPIRSGVKSPCFPVCARPLAHALERTTLVPTSTSPARRQNLTSSKLRFRTTKVSRTDLLRNRTKSHLSIELRMGQHLGCRQDLRRRCHGCQHVQG